MKKRVLCIVLAAMMGFACLSACSPNNNTGTTGSTSSTSTSTTTTTTDSNTADSSAGDTTDNGDSAAATSTDNNGGYQKFDDVQLTMLICWNGGYKTPEDQYNNPVATAIREKIGVTVKFEGIMMSEQEKLNLMFASGDMPDIVNAPFWGGYGGETGIIKKGASEGRLLPIEDILPKYPNVQRSYDIGVISQKYLETDLSDPMFDGHLYLIPQETPGNTDHLTNWTYGVFVRGDVPAALGIDEKSIKTSEDLYDFMVKARDYGFKDINGNPTVVASTFHDGWDYSRYAESFSTPKLTSFVDMGDGTVSFDSLTPAWIEKNLFLWRLVNEGLLDKECFKITDSQADAKIGNGTALFFASQYGPGINATKQTGLYNTNPEMRYIPVGPMNDINGNPLVQVESYGRTGSPVIFFPETCSNIDAAMTYIDYINSPEGMTYSQYGIEGVTFEYNEQGQPRLLPEFLERKKSGDATWEDAVREVGGKNYIDGRLWFGNLKKDWFGEDGLGDADAAVQEMEDYKLARPVVQLPGYALAAFEGEFPQIDKIRATFFEGDPEKTYRERAYFAATEAEARSILESWQENLRTAENGLFMEFLNFMAEKAKTRNDIVF